MGPRPVQRRNTRSPARMVTPDIERQVKEQKGGVKEETELQVGVGSREAEDGVGEPATNIVQQTAVPITDTRDSGGGARRDKEVLPTSAQESESGGHQCRTGQAALPRTFYPPE